ncbi:MAG: hypothetical protein QM817_09930 [Archangium sp.]
MRTFRSVVVVAVLVASSALAQPVGEEVVERGSPPAGIQPRLELLLYPVRAQINPLYTNHVGSSGAVQLRLSDSFAFMISGGYDWFSSVSPFNAQLVENFRVEEQASQSLLWTWSTLAGVEVSPAFGQLRVGNSGTRFGLFLNGGLGAGGSRHQLIPATELRASPMYGDTGVRFLGSLGAGLRVQLGERLTIRLEVRDVAASGAVSTVNGCSGADLRTIQRSFNLADDFESGSIGSSCRTDAFMDGSGPSRLAGVSSALSLTQSNSQAPLIHTVTAALGASFVF